MLLLCMQEIVPVDFLGGPFVLSRGGGGGGGQTRWLQAYTGPNKTSAEVARFSGQKIPWHVECIS